ncbi:MAG: translocation/assembly module TamB domain-containing protein [Lysobacterales bacterium]
MRRRILKWVLIAAALLLLLTSLALYWLLYTESGLGWTLQRGLGAAGGSIEYQQLRGNLAQGFELDTPVIKAPGVRISAVQLRMQLRPWALLGGELSLESLRLSGARYTFEESGESTADAEAGAVGRPGGLDLPVDVVLRNIELLANEINLGGDAPVVFSVGAREIALRDGKLKVEGLALSQGEFALRTSAAVDTNADWAGELASEGEWTLPAVAHRGKLTLSGDLDEVNVDLTMEGGGEVNFEANLAQPLDTPGVQGRFGAQSLDLQSFGLDAPVRMLDIDLSFDYANEKLGIQGPVTVDGKTLNLTIAGIGLENNQVHLERAELKSRAIGSLSFGGYWPLSAEAGPGQITGRMKGLWLGDWRGDVPKPAPRLDGDLKFGGRADDWQLDLSGSWHQGEASGPIELSAAGTPERIVIAPSQLSWERSRVDLSGEIALGDSTSIEVDLAVAALDPALLVPDWPGALDVKLHASVSVAEESHWSLTGIDLKGTLREQALALTGTLDGTDASPTAGKLDLSWGQGQLGLNVAEDAGISADLKDFDLSLLAPVNGKLSGRISTRLDADLVDATEATLQLRDFESNGISGGLIEIDKGSGWALELTASELTREGAVIKPLKLSLSGNQAEHRLSLVASEARGRIELGLAGSLVDEVWTGVIDKLELEPIHGAAWSLAEPAALRLAADSTSMAPLCLSAKPARACIGLQRSAEQTLIDIDLVELALAELQAWAPASDWTVTGKLSGGGQLSLDPEGQFGGKLDFGIEAGTLRGATQLEEPLAFDGLASFDSAAAEFSARLNLVDHGQINVRATGLNTAEGAYVANLDISDLSLVDGLTAEVQSMRGALSGELRAPLAAPSSLQGQLEATALSFELPAAGLKATDGTLTVLFENDGLLRLEGDLGIAPGRVHLQGLIGLDEEGATEITIRGDNAALVDLPAVRLIGDSNFVIKQNKDGFQIEGGVLLREGKIDLDRFAPTVPASEDVVIVDAPPPPPPLPIKADISLAFISAVDLRGFGLEASLSGGIRVTQRPGTPVQAQGEMLVRGIYSSYGQKLDIERGRLGFTGRADNPSLDILAVKKIDRQRVGVQVRGNARRPAVRLYSDPSLDQSETVSYLVLGRPLATASGSDGQQVGEYASALQSAGGGLVAGSIGQKIGVSAGVESFGAAIGSALVVGKYISPRFFVGYGTSLLNATQLVILRYRLTENIELEGISGTEQKMSASWRTER